MSYPKEFTPFDWEDLPAESTPVDKEDLQEAERRLAKFASEFEIHWRAPVKKVSELYKAPNVEKGDVAFVEEIHEIWYYSGVEWFPILDALRFWKEPVAEEAALPVTGNVIGDVRLDIETFQFYICYNTTGTVVEQWKLFVPAAHTHTTETLTWSVAEALTTEPEVIPGGFRRLATEEVQHLYEVEFELRKGTAELELKINGTAVKFEGGSTKAKVKEAAKALPLETPHTFAAKDKIELIVHSVSEEPEGLAFSAFVEHIAKAV
jgi:hypothetical protein